MLPIVSAIRTILLLFHCSWRSEHACTWHVSHVSYLVAIELLNGTVVFLPCWWYCIIL